MQPFEAKLRSDLNWAFQEVDRYFQGRGTVRNAIRGIVHHLDTQHIRYAVAGDVAMFMHGFRQFTSTIEVLLTSEGIGSLQPMLMEKCHDTSANGRHLRDRATGVLVEIFLAGQFPGDGKPKPVAFPNPAAKGVVIDGVRYLQLETLVELKLASGMTNPGRLKDLADVQELIRVLKLGQDFESKLDPYVRGKFAELRQAVEMDRGE